MEVSVQRGYKKTIQFDNQDNSGNGGMICPRHLTDEIDDDGDFEVGGELGHLGLLHHPRLQVQELAGGVVSPFRPLPSLAAVATGVI